jgi:hypothetical protein
MMDLGDLLQDKTFTIADLYRPMEGFGPHAGTPVEFDCIVAGKDLVAVDATACRMVGLPLGKVEYFDAALQKGLGRFAEEDIEIRGEAIDDVKRQLYIPYLDGFGAFLEYDFHVKAACSTCQGLTAFTMSKLKALGEYDKNAGVHVVLGWHKDTPEELLDGQPVFLMGDCTLTLKKRLDEAGVTSFYVHGCPPPEPTPWLGDRRPGRDDRALRRGSQESGPGTAQAAGVRRGALQRVDGQAGKELGRG